MGARHTPTVSELRHEARSLRHLLRSYLDDRGFIHKSQSARLLYFVDAHEIKSYIDPISPESLVGFILKAEQAVIKSSAAQFDLAIRLKSDQLLRELLFAQLRCSPDPPITLPTDSAALARRASPAQTNPPVRVTRRSLGTRASGSVYRGE